MKMIVLTITSISYLVKSITQKKVGCGKDSCFGRRKTCTYAFFRFVDIVSCLSKEQKYRVK